VNNIVQPMFAQMQNVDEYSMPWGWQAVAVHALLPLLFVVIAVLSQHYIDEAPLCRC